MSLWILEPHDGEFGIGCWVSCQAPTCLTRDPAIAGSFAIRAHEPHFVDRTRHQHVHAVCGERMVSLGLAQWKTVADRRSA